MKASPSSGAAALALLPLLLVALGCGPGAPPPPANAGDAAPTMGAPWFEDVTAGSGIDFTHASGFDGSYYMPEIMGGGLALFDVEGDGDLDLYFVDGGDRVDGGDPASAEQVIEGSGGRLYANRGDGTFEDVTVGSGLGHAGYGMGCAVGDPDADGDLDLFVTTLGRDVFYRNLGDGTFEDATEAAGLLPADGIDGWSTSAGFFDAEGDGDLDLYVVRYVAYSERQRCTTLAGQPEYCGPQAFPGVTDRLYLGRGDGTFEDASEATGIDRLSGRGLGLALLDLDADGAVEIFVANDGEPNQLWDPRGVDDAGRPLYEERAVLMGVAVDLQGRSEASMGVAIGDADGDGDLDLFATHLEQETNTLYLSADGQGFEDRSAGSGLGRPSLPTTGFGTAFFDADLDGDLDLLVANGKVRLEAGADQRTGIEGTPDRGNVLANAADARQGLAPYAEPHHLYENLGSGRFELRPEPSLGAVGIGRGLAVGDLDGDGDLDAVIAQIHASPRVLRNVAPARGRWLALRVLGADGRDALGATVTLHGGGQSWSATVGHTASYLSSHDATLHLGVGETLSIDRVEVRWPGPDGLTERFGPLQVGQQHLLRRGMGGGEGDFP